MNSNIIIQSLKSQLHSMKLQIDNIEIQNNNMMMGMNDTIVEQLLNISIQIINVGIQAFISEINKIINNNKFYEQLREASGQINSLVNSYDMQQQMIQQQIMQQQMIQQQIMQQQMTANDATAIGAKKNVIFQSTGGRLKTIVANYDTTLKEVIDQYMDSVFGYENEKIKFILNARVLNRYDERKIQDVWDLTDIPIKVIE